MKQIISRFFQSSGQLPIDDRYKSGVLLLQKGNYAGALQAFRATAAYGHVSSIYNLALMYKQGLTESFEIDEAIALFKQAAELGHERANAHWALFQKLGSDQGLSSEDLTGLIVNFSRTGGDGAFVFGLASEIMRTTLNRKDLIEFVMIELDGASRGNASAASFVQSTGIPRSAFDGSMGRSTEGTPARLHSDLLDHICVLLMGNGIPQSSVIFARCSVVGYVIKKRGIAPIGALLPFTAFKDDAP